ncbi:MAG: nuclease-related domain-containing protein [Candidatus Melainabacteria bacterium]|nr:nuclease-related domain-containing protein [Candidatus Melainabacteria bacterium]
MEKATYRGPKELALQRHRKATHLRRASIVALAIPICYFITAGFDTPLWMVCLFLALARLLYLEFKSMKQAAERAEKGGRAEDQVAEILGALKDSGWHVEQNVLIPRRGDVDFVVTSPNQKVFAIDVKSHAGIITERDRQLLRDDKPLDNDFIANVRQQASLISSQRGCGIVIPVLAFTRAKLKLSEETVDGVYVIRTSRLIETLLNISGLSKSIKGKT